MKLFQSNINGLRMCDNCNDFQQLLYNVEREHEATIAGGDEDDQDYVGDFVGDEMDVANMNLGWG